MSSCDVIFVKKHNYIVTSPILVRYKHKAKKRHNDITLQIKGCDSDEWMDTGIQFELLAQRSHLQLHGEHTEEKAMELEKQIEKAAQEKYSIRENWMKSISKNISALQSLMVAKNSKLLFDVLEQMEEDRFDIAFRCDDLPDIYAHGYYWNAHDKVIVSDVDGTVSKSDLLGHILPRLGIGMSWQQPGVVANARALAKNGYKMIYLTARPITMASSTKKYIFGLREIHNKENAMPFGPVLTTPYHMVNSFAVEIVIQQPHVFKTQLMTAVAKLFDKGHGICAAFGNKTTDESAYATLIDDSSMIFTINSHGHMKNLDNKFFKGYRGLVEQVEELFPKVNAKELASSVEEEVPTREEVAKPDEDHIEKKAVKEKEERPEEVLPEEALETYAEDDASLAKKVLRKAHATANLSKRASKKLAFNTITRVASTSQKVMDTIQDVYESYSSSSSSSSRSSHKAKRTRKKLKKRLKKAFDGDANGDKPAEVVSGGMNVNQNDKFTSGEDSPAPIEEGKRVSAEKILDQPDSDESAEEIELSDQEAPSDSQESSQSQQQNAPSDESSKHRNRTRRRSKGYAKNATHREREVDPEQSS